MAKTNYNHAKRQKENARKARQQEKLAKKLARLSKNRGLWWRNWLTRLKDALSGWMVNMDLVTQLASTVH